MMQVYRRHETEHTAQPIIPPDLSQQAEPGQ